MMVDLIYECGANCGREKVRAGFKWIIENGKKSRKTGSEGGF